MTSPANIPQQARLHGQAKRGPGGRGFKGPRSARTNTTEAFRLIVVEVSDWSRWTTRPCSGENDSPTARHPILDLVKCRLNDGSVIQRQNLPTSPAVILRGPIRDLGGIGAPPILQPTPSPLTSAPDTTRMMAWVLSLSA